MTEQEQKDFEFLFENYFKLNNCSEYFTIRNKYSKIDYLINSGCTIPVEYKNRHQSVYNFESTLIEKKKIRALTGTSSLLDSGISYFINEYLECFIVYVISKKMNVVYQSIPMQNNDTDKFEVDKLVTFLPYSSAEIIISKKDMKRKTFDELDNYIKVMNEHIRRSITIN